MSAAGPSLCVRRAAPRTQHVHPARLPLGGQRAAQGGEPIRTRRIATSAARQRGGFLLEALIGILIFTLGVLGLVALQARAIGYSSDTQFRGEAAYLANAYIAKMWAESRANLTARYDDPGETEYDAFAAAVARLPGGVPTVTITPAPAGGMLNPPGSVGMALTENSTMVTIVINWQQPANERSTAPVTHNYTISSVLGLN